jgi:hypothetical protein
MSSDDESSDFWDEEDWRFTRLATLKKGLAAIRAHEEPPNDIALHGSVFTDTNEDGLLIWSEEAIEVAKEFFREFRTQYPTQRFGLIFAEDFHHTTIIAPILHEVTGQVRALTFQGCYGEPCHVVGGLEPLLEVLHKQQALEEFSQHWCTSFFTDESEPAALVKCLSALPALKTVTFGWCLDEVEISDNTRVETVTALAQIKGLEHLKLEELPTYSNLQGLFASFTPKSSLKTLEIYLTYLSASNIEYVAQMLQCNPSIEDLVLKLHPDASVSSIAKSLETNSKLRVLFIAREGFTENDTAPFLCLLKDKKNCTLETLTLSIPLQDDFIQLDDEINFYLKLNKEFQRKLLFSSDETATREDWINTIITARKDTAVVFYYLSENLSLLLEANNHNQQSVLVTRTLAPLQQEPPHKKAKHE